MRISDWSSDVCTSDLKPLKIRIDRLLNRFGNQQHLEHSAANFSLPRIHPLVETAVEQTREIVAAREQVKTTDLMHDAGEHRGIGIDMGYPSRDHMRERGNLRGDRKSGV